MILGQYVTVDGHEGYSIVQAADSTQIPQIPVTLIPETTPSEAQIQADSGTVDSPVYLPPEIGYFRNH